MIFVKSFFVLLTIIFCFNSTYAKYSLSERDKTQVYMVVVKANNFIEAKGERYRNILISKLNRILNERNMSIRVTAIYKYLLDSLKLLEDEEEGFQYDSKVFNHQEVRDYWVGLLNSVRDEDGLPKYTYNRELDYTSYIWSNQALKRGYIDHKVDVGDSYYDYRKKQKWMEDNGVVCENIKRITFSESIAWGQFYCSKDDCTNGVKKIIKSTYDFYMSEKGKAYAPHYDAIINPYFRQIGLGLSLKIEANNRYTLYITNHYCTNNIK